MNWDDFQARAKRVVPAREIKAKRSWIGVLSHEKAPQDELDETDFVWMIGHSNITIQTIHEVYAKRHENLEFHLRYRDAQVDNSEIVKPFLSANDNIVLFLARSNTSPRVQPQSSHQDPSVTMTSDANSDHTEPGRQTSILPSPKLTTRIKDESRDNGEATQSSLRFTDTVASPAAPVGGLSPSNMATSRLSYPALKTVTYDLSVLQADAVVKDEKCSAHVYHHHLDEDVHASFNPETFFKQEPSVEERSQEQFIPINQFLRELINRTNPDILERGVALSIKVLQSLMGQFTAYASINQDAQAWTEAIGKLTPQGQRKRTVIGVVGNTGAGKSSVINALLDEERLVPTNCMRACTAVVTEMSWNSSTDPGSKYRAEVEFVSASEWEREVGSLMTEFLTESGNLSREAADQGTDAGIAWAKFHSVYPNRTRDTLGECTVNSLMSEPRVAAVLGTTKTISTASPSHFYQQLQKYVDSKEKFVKEDKNKEKGRKKDPLGMEHWPLIKVVKIYMKAAALSTGAVIVDLPGVHDSNAARAAVAQGYMKQCTGLWIVAPINRAVDDKAAKTLLGDSFKRQLKYDGGFASVTFICSKTDDISITEAIDTLELEDEVDALYEQQHQFEQDIESIQEKLRDLKEAKEVYRIAQAEASHDIDVLNQLRDDLEDGQIVFAPDPRGIKRKKSASKQKQAQKKRRIHDHDEDEDEDFIVSDAEDSPVDSDGEEEDVQSPLLPLSDDDIKVRLKELREAKTLARRRAIELTEIMRQQQPQLNALNAQVVETKAEISHICISGRNNYSKRAIQQDFAAGIKELDQENAAEEDEAHFNPDEEMRDYENVARSLPVFCVSSRAYQKICGRLQKDDNVPGFKTAEETEMPQLQAHCKRLTEAGRIQTARTFLLSLCQLLTTFSLWANNDGIGLKMTDDDLQTQLRYLEKRLEELERGLKESVRTCLNVMKKEMNEQIFDRYPDLIKEAINAAPGTADKWGAHKADGGLHWGTYKAIVRHDGTYHSATVGLRDFNADLISPIVKKLASGWEHAFQDRLPNAFATFTKSSGTLLHSFHAAVEELARKNGVGLASLAALNTQIHTYEHLFNELNQVLITKMTELQRDANRDFTPTIANIMHTVYELCASEHGQGSFMRMKQHMADNVEQNRHVMFHQATLTIQHHLDELCKVLEDVMEEKADEIYVKMKADYMRVLGGVQISAEALMPKEERALKANIMNILRSVDAQFEPIVKGETIAEDAINSAVAEAEQRSVDGYDDSAFESAREEINDFVMDGNDDAMTTEPTPLESAHAGLDVEDSSKKEDHGLPTPSDEDERL